MRVLALSNLYPPSERGGEELSAQAVVNGLRSHGHVVEVITSEGEANSKTGTIHRELKFEMESKPLWNAVRFFTRRRAIIDHDEGVLKKHLSRFQPDIMLIFSMWNIPREVPYIAENLMPGKVVYRLASYWPVQPSQHLNYWQATSKSRLAAVPKGILRPIALDVLENNPLPRLKLEHSICISQAVFEEFKEQGVELKDVTIIHNGIRVDQFDNGSSPWGHGLPPEPIKLLYLGRISPEKGVHTALETLALLKDAYPDITLSLAGSVWDADYWSGLVQFVNQHGLNSRVRFYGHLPSEQVSTLLHEHDVMLVPSVWAEPFGRVVLEGMAAGLVVIGTGRGGMQTALRDGETGLVFSAEDAKGLAEKIKWLIANPELGWEIVQTAMNEVRTKFTEKRMVAAYEERISRLYSSGTLN
jgi:glycosyltransferase involved in cell wall biosynthesis